jgi:hypothetical protein
VSARARGDSRGCGGTPVAEATDARTLARTSGEIDMQKRDVKKLALTTTRVRKLSAEDMTDVAGGRRTQSGTCTTADDYCLCKVCW